MQRTFHVLTLAFVLSAFAFGEKIDRRPLTIGYVENSDNRCSGTLLAAKIVLTAAHCVKDRPVNSIRFSLSHNAFVPEAKFAVASEVMISPQFRASTKDSPAAADLAIVKLQTADYGTAPDYFYPLLPSDEFPSGRQAAAIGYGYNPDGTNGTRRVRRVSFDRFMSATASDEKPIARALMNFKRGVTGQIPCGGDSGGPLVAIINGRAGIIALVAQSTVSTDVLPTNVNGGMDTSPTTVCQKKELSHGTSVWPFRDWVESLLPAREIATSKAVRGFGPELMGLVPTLPE